MEACLTEMSHAILIVDDEPGIRQSLTSILRDEGYRVEAVASGEDCLAATKRQAFDLAGRCVEWRTTRGDAHAFHYTVSIT